MIKLEGFKNLLKGALSFPVYTDELPRGKNPPAVAWHHNGIVYDNGGGRELNGKPAPYTHSWRVYVVTKGYENQQAIMEELALLDGTDNDDFQDIKIVFADSGQKPAPNANRVGVVDFETVDAPQPDRHENQGAVMMASGGNMTMSQPVAIYPEDRIMFEYIADSEVGEPYLLASNETEAVLQAIDGELVVRGKYLFSTLSGKGLPLDGHRGKISGEYVGNTKTFLWAPLTEMPIYNLNIKRGGIAKELGLSDLFFPLDDRHYDVIGGTVNVTLED